MRFLGKTPLTSTISGTFRSIISQLDYLYFKENLLQDFKDFDSIQLNKMLFERLKKIAKKYSDQKILIFLDSFDQLNKLDHNLNWFIKEYPENTKVVYSTLTNHGNIIETLKQKGVEEESFLKVSKLDFQTSIKMFNNSMDNNNRELANENQKKVVDTLFSNKSTKLYPFFVKLIFDIAKLWY